MPNESHLRRWSQRFRGWVSFLADLWDAAKIAALSVGLIVAAAVGTAIFLLDIMPPLLLAMLLVGIVGVSTVFLHGVARKLLPKSTPSPPVVGHLEPSNPNVRAAAMQQSWLASQAEEKRREDEIKLRRAIRLIREELLDNKHALDRIAAGEAGAVKAMRANEWEQHQGALIEHHEPEPHAKTGAAYRELVPILRLRYRTSRIDSALLEEDPDPGSPLETDVLSALEAIEAAVAALASAENRSG